MLVIFLSVPATSIAFSLFPIKPSIVMTAAPTTILTGGSTVIVWTVTSADTCIASGGWDGAKNALGGSQNVAPDITTVYTLTCTGEGGTDVKSITVIVNAVSTGQANLKPVTAIVANDMLTAGKSVTFTARTQNTGTKSTDIGFHNNFSYRWASTDSWTDLSPFNSKPALAAEALATPDTSPRLMLDRSGTLDIQYCADSYHIINESNEFDNCIAYRFTVASAPISGPPIINLLANPEHVTRGESSVLSWTVRNADSCTASGGWSGNKNAVGGSQNVAPLTMTTYTLSCTGEGGTDAKNVTVTVSLPPISNTVNLVPVGTINHMSGELTSGKSVTFTARTQNTGTKSTDIGFHNNFSYRWASTDSWTDLSPFNSKPALASGAVASVDSSPSLGLNQVGTLTVQYCADSYKIIPEDNEDDNCIQQNFLIANQPLPPTITFTGNPLVITSGQNTTLTWTVQNADSCTASGGWSGNKNAVGGSQNVAPLTTTTYTLSCTGAGGADSKNVVITVNPDGGIGPNPNPLDITFRICDPGAVGCVVNSGTKYVTPGAPLEIRWTTRGARSCIGTNFSTNNQLSGVTNTIANVLPAISLRYQISCTNGTETTMRSITVITSAQKPKLRVNPTLIRAGESVTVEWETNNGDESLCVLSGGGINSAATLGNGTGGPDTGSATKALWSKTTFTLICGILAADPITVEIRPSAFET